MDKIFEDFANKIGRIVEDAVKKNKDIKYVNVSENYQMLADVFNYQKIQIVTNGVDIKLLKTSNRKDVRLYLSDKCDINKLSVEVMEKDKETLQITILYGGDNANGYLIIEGFNGRSIVVDSKSADITINEMEVEKILLNTLDGDIGVNNCQFLSADFESRNGDISIKLMNSCEMDLHSANGDIDCDHSLDVKNSERTLKCHSKNGDITVQKV